MKRYSVFVFCNNSYLCVASYRNKCTAEQRAKKLLYSGALGQGGCLEVAVWDSKRKWEDARAWKTYIWR